MEMAYFKTYSSFNKQRFAWFIIIGLIRRINQEDAYFCSESETLPQIAS